MFLTNRVHTNWTEGQTDGGTGGQPKNIMLSPARRHNKTCFLLFISCFTSLCSNGRILTTDLIYTSCVTRIVWEPGISKLDSHSAIPWRQEKNTTSRGRPGEHQQHNLISNQMIEGAVQTLFTLLCTLACYSLIVYRGFISQPVVSALFQLTS